MSDIDERYKQTLKEAMQEVEKDFQTFIRALSEKQSDLYLDLYIQKIFKDILMTSITLQEVEQLMLQNKFSPIDEEYFASDGQRESKDESKGEKKFEEGKYKSAIDKVVIYYGLKQLHQEFYPRWVKQVRGMMTKGKRIDLGETEKSFWNKFEEFCTSKIWQSSPYYELF